MPELVFQQASDTMLREQSPTASFASAPSLSVDGNTSGSNESQVLLRFDDLQFDQIPEGATITSATLTMQTVDTGSGAELHRMLVPWSADDTYATLENGVQADGTEAIADADLVTGRISALGLTSFDVITSVQAWADGAENNGWVLLPPGNDSWDFSASEGALAPTLTVTYTLDPDTPEIPPPPPPSSDTPFDVTLTPTDSTPTVAGSGDRADDPAVLLHPTTLSQSVILGTDKDTGDDGRLYVYNLNGDVIETASVGRSINNVDVRYQFDLGGTQTALIGASERSDGDLIFYTYDFAARDLRPVGEVSSSGVYGFALGYVDGTHYAYAATNSGTIRQYELDGSSGTVTAQLVRTFNVGSETEGLVVDDQTGQLYVAEENVGIWRYDASAEAGTSRVLVDKVGSGGHLTADVEGLAIYHESDGSGILIASSQGEDAFEFYDTATNAWLGTLELEGVTHTDGLDVTNANLGGVYAEGLFITQVDGVNNFAFTSWGAISNTTGLPTNSSYDARYDPYML